MKTPVKSISLILALAVAAFAQTQTTGRIAGVVRDQNGAVIVGANVTVVNQGTRETRSAATDADGGFTFAFLAAGPYSVDIRADGFEPVKIDMVNASVTESASVNVTLTVSGPVVDPVLVKNPPFVTTTDGPALGQVFEAQTISDLPLATRNFTQLLGLVAGSNAYLTDNTVVGRNSQNVSINGARVSQNNFQINGIDANAGIGVGLPLANPSAESIAEFKVQTSLYDATFGRAGGGNVQVITKSGSNKLSGTVYDYFSDTGLTANSPFLKAIRAKRPVLERNIFGFVLGGALRKDRAYFFVSYQTTRERNGASWLNSLSSNILIAPGLTDDRSEGMLSSTFGVPVHPISLRLLNARLPNGQFVIPTPQLASGRYSGSAISRFRDEQFNANIDYHISPQNLASVKFFFSNAPQFLARRGAVNVPGFGIDQIQDNRLLAVQDVHVFTTHVTNEVRFGYNYVKGDSFPQQPVVDSNLGANLSIPRVTADTFPGLGLVRIGRDANGISFGTGVQQDRQTTAPSISITDTVSITRGKHIVRLGGEFRYYEFNVTSNLLTRGNIDFDTFTDFLRGTTALGVLANGLTERNLRTTDHNFFVQDDWKLTPRLSLSLGVRYGLDLPPYDTRGRISAFDASLYVPNLEGGPPAGGIVQAGNALAQYDLDNIPNVSKRVGRIDTNNIAPRLGAAYSVVHSGRIVARGGYGVFYSRPSFLYLVSNMYLPPYYAVNGTFNHPPFEAAFPFVPAQTEFPRYPFGSILLGNSFDRNNVIPLIQQYNASLQFSLSRNLLLEAAFAGSKGSHLYRRVGINQASLATADHPIRGITINTPGNAQSRAPFQGIIVRALDLVGFNQDQTNAKSEFNSLQMRLSRRFSRGIQFLASYTFSRSIDNASGTGGGSGTDGVIDSVQIGDTSFFVGDQLSEEANRGLSNFDRPHRLVTSFVWQVPRPVFFSRSRLGRSLFAGWQVSGIVTLMSGLPIDVIDTAGSSFYLGAGGGGGRPNFVAGESPTRNVPAGYYFNPYAFARAIVRAGEAIPSSFGLAFAGANGTDFGNVGRNSLRGPRQFNTDISISKRFRLSDARDLEFRADFFNLFNNVNFANPISNFAAVTQQSDGANAIDPNTGRIVPGRAGDFGRIISASSNQRIIQFAVKFNF
jgi:hypothetical protein